MALYSRKRNRKDYVRGPELKSVGYVFQDDQWHAVPSEPAITGPHFFGLAAAGAPPGVLSWQLCKPLCINVVLEGSNGANRTGTAINMHKLSVKVLAMRQLNGVVDGVNQSLLIQNRLMIVYDKGGDISGAHGFSPKIQEIIGVPNPVHAAPYLTVWADQNPASAERFEILYDSFRVAPSSNQAWTDPGQPWSQWTFDLDLGGRRTVYNSTLGAYNTGNDRAQQVVTGGLFLVAIGTGINQDQPLPLYNDPMYKVIGQVTLYFTG